MNQVQDYIEKIKNILTTTNNYIPYVLQTFYTLLKAATLEVQEKDISLQLIGNYGNIYQFLKKWLQESKSTIKQRQTIQPQLKKLLTPFRKFIPLDDISRCFIKNFEDQLTYKKIREMRQNSDKIMQQYHNKNNNIHVSGNTDICLGFWINKFKADYAVHINVFWDAFIDFTKDITYFQKFISDSSKKTIRDIIDPDHKYYVGMAIINDLFLQLAQPQLLRLLAQQTAKGYKQPNFVSTKNIKLKFTKKTDLITKIQDGDVFIVNGKQAWINGQQIVCKYPPTIRFGSSNDTDILIKNKFLSRKQFMLIEQDQGYSIICLSPSNFTTVSYPNPYELKQGTLFKINNQTIQVLRIGQKIQNNFSEGNHGFSLTQYQTTLQYLPQNDSIIISKQLEYKILTGPYKDKKGIISSSEDKIKANDQDQLSLICNSNQFFIPEETPVLLKNANQILTGHLSEKVLLREGMKIILDQCDFIVQ